MEPEKPIKLETVWLQEYVTPESQGLSAPLTGLVENVKAELRSDEDLPQTVIRSNFTKIMSSSCPSILKTELCPEEYLKSEPKLSPIKSESFSDEDISQDQDSSLELEDNPKIMLEDHSPDRGDDEVRSLQTASPDSNNSGNHQSSDKTRHTQAVHERTQTGEWPNKCNICAKMFTKRSYLARHMKTHREDRTYECCVCSKMFKSNSNLASHMNSHIRDRRQKCKVCTKMFTRASVLARHIKTHTEERPHKCDVCAKMFKLSWNLASHMKTHTGERPYKCDMCVKMFIRGDDLARHIKTHTAERPHTCEICEKVFEDDSVLANHRRTHTGEKAYQCSVCPNMFIRRSALAQHLRTHLGNDHVGATKHSIKEEQYTLEIDRIRESLLRKCSSDAVMYPAT